MIPDPNLQALLRLYLADEGCLAGLLLAWGLWGVLVSLWLGPVPPTG